MKVIAVPDLHFPFAHADALSLLYSKLEIEKPDVVVQMGDALDCFSFSRFPGTKNIMTPKEEISQGLAQLDAFWETVGKLCKKAKKYQIFGNHEERIPKSILAKMPEMESLFSLDDIFQFKGVETIPADGSLELDGVLYIHGYFLQPYQHMRYYLKPVVFGHTHRAWVLHDKIHGKNLSEMTCGYLGDDSFIPLKYTMTKINRWTKGYGLIEGGEMSFKTLNP